MKTPNALEKSYSPPFHHFFVGEQVILYADYFLMKIYFFHAYLLNIDVGMMDIILKHIENFNFYIHHFNHHKSINPPFSTHRSENNPR